MRKIFEYFSNLKLKHFEEKMKKLKPQLLLRWYDIQEETIRKEYEEEMEHLHNELFELRQNLKELTKSRDYYRGKYEGVIETQEKVREELITKVESNAEDNGKLKEQIEQLKND